MPQLRPEAAPGFVHCIHHRLPCGERVLAPEPRHIRLIACGGAGNERGLGNDQAHIGACPAGIVVCSGCGQYAAGRKGTRHGRHDQSIATRKFRRRKRREQRRSRSSRLLRNCHTGNPQVTRLNRPTPHQIRGVRGHHDLPILVGHLNQRLNDSAVGARLRQAGVFDRNPHA